jgi:hypothetical protein
MAIYVGQNVSISQRFAPKFPHGLTRWNCWIAILVQKFSTSAPLKISQAVSASKARTPKTALSRRLPQHLVA